MKKETATSGGMKAIVWGSTGSLPSPLTSEALRKKITAAIAAAQGRKFASPESIDHFVRHELPFAAAGTYNGNTSCVELRRGNEYVLLDAGSGLRDFGSYALQNIPAPARFHIFLSHLHWDHIQGIPFFPPAFCKGNRIDFYGGHADIEQALTVQQQPPFFPVPFDAMQADMHFHHVQPGDSPVIAGYKLSVIRQDHPGGSFGYCLERDGRKIVYSTDFEHREETEDPYDRFIEFARGADLLIFDAQYSLFETIGDKATWGHSSNIIGVEIAVKAQARHLCLFHSEHSQDDAALEKIYQGARQYASFFQQPGCCVPEISIAYDGLEIDL